MFQRSVSIFHLSAIVEWIKSDDVLISVFLPDKSQIHDDDTSLYGNIDQVDTSGASESTAKINKLISRAPPRSHVMPFVARMCYVFYQLKTTHYRRGIF